MEFLVDNYAGPCNAEEEVITKKYVKLFQLLFFSSLLTNTGFAQIIWQRSYGGTLWDYGACVQQTIDGGYIVAGSTNSFGNEDQVYLIKIDSLGDTLWSRTYGGTADDYGRSVQQTTDGGYIIAGSTNSFGNDDQVYLIKTDSLGDTLWTTTYGGTSFDNGYSTQQTADGGFIITGYTYSYGNSIQVYLIKADPIGDTIWTKTYGNAGDEMGFCVKQTIDGGYIIVGDDYTNGKVYLVKTDSLGDTLWSRFYGSSLLGDDGRSVQQTTDGGYIITGNALTMPHNHDVLLIKTDSLGNSLWFHTYGGNDWNLYSYGQSVQQTTDGSYVIVGKTNIGDPYFQVLLMKTNTSGDSLWSRTYGGGSGEEGLYVQQTQDGGFIIAGASNSWGNATQVYVIKTDANGNTFIKEDKIISVINNSYGTTIFSGSLILPEGKSCKVVDITGRIVKPDMIQPGIYFIKVDGKITRKVVKVR